MLLRCIGLFVLALMASCLTASGPAVAPCSHPDACFNISISNERNRCPSRTQRGWSLENNHPTKALIVSYAEQVQHLNQPIDNEVRERIYRNLRPQSSIPEGCEFVQVGTELFDRFSYIERAACFEGDPACEFSSVEPSTRSCADRCVNGHPSCHREYLPVGQQAKDLYALSEKIRKTNLPISLPLTVSVSASVCPNRGPLYIDKSGEFEETGDHCTFDYKYDGMRTLVDVGGVIAGDYDQRSRTLKMNPGNSPKLHFYDQSGQYRGMEELESILVARQFIRISGRLRYCAETHWPSDP